MICVSLDIVQEHLKGVIEGRIPSTHVICDGTRSTRIKNLEALKAMAMGRAIFKYSDEEVYHNLTE